MILYADNRPILELCLGKPLGILSILDQESRFHRTTEATLLGIHNFWGKMIKGMKNLQVFMFLDKLNFNLAENKFYGKSASSADCSFTVRHYAGKFVYKVKDFLKKNRNWQSAGLFRLIHYDFWIIGKWINFCVYIIKTLLKCCETLKLK